MFSHVRIARTPDDIHAIRVSAGKADLVLGCDLVVSGAKKVLAAVREGHTIFVANTAEIMPGDFTRSADFSLPTERLKRAIRKAAGEERAHFFDATRTAAALFGNSLGANMFMLGFAFQHGGLPLSAEAVEKAIELNGEAVAMNVAAFRWGRRAAHEPDFVRRLIAVQGVPARAADRADARRDRRAPRRLPDRLSEPPPMPRRYRAPHRRDPRSRGQGRAGLDRGQRGGGAQPVQADGDQGRVRGRAALHRRLVPAPARRRSSRATTGSNSISRRRSSAARAPDGKPRKSSFGPWMMTGFRVLAALKRLRGTPLDVFGYTAERRMERALLADTRAIST